MRTIWAILAASLLASVAAFAADAPWYLREDERELCRINIRGVDLQRQLTRDRVEKYLSCMNKDLTHDCDLEFKTLEREHQAGRYAVRKTWECY